MNIEQKAAEILKENGFKLFEVLPKMTEPIYIDALITFEADVFGVIRAVNLLEKEGITVMQSCLDLSIVEGVLEKPCGYITFPDR